MIIRLKKIKTSIEQPKTDRPVRNPDDDQVTVDATMCQFNILFKDCIKSPY